MLDQHVELPDVHLAAGTERALCGATPGRRWLATLYQSATCMQCRRVADEMLGDDDSAEALDTVDDPE